MKSPEVVLRIQITLLGTDPPIWRRVEIGAECSFSDLHKVIQRAMGWQDSHMHMFRATPRGARRTVLIGPPDPEIPSLSSKTTAVRAHLAELGDTVLYEYDFGDGWVHAVTLEGLLLADPDLTYPRCVAGARKCPPEDVGGIGGYEEFVEAVTNKRHPEHEAKLEWYGGAYDPEDFSPSTVVFDPKAARRRRASRRPE